MKTRADSTETYGLLSSDSSRFIVGKPPKAALVFGWGAMTPDGSVPYRSVRGLLNSLMKGILLWSPRILGREKSRYSA